MAGKKFTSDDVRDMMSDIKKVRNIVTVGALGTGKTNVIDCLGSRCGLVAEDKIGSGFALIRPDEKEKKCTIKASITSMIVDDVLMSILDTPGHTEYSAELSACMPLADGAIVCCDGSGAGLAAQTSQHVKEMMSWGVEPIMFCNKLDISFLTTKKSASEITDDLFGVVDLFNASLSTYPCPITKEPKLVSPEKGSVIFGSLQYGWGFTIPMMASIYAAKFQMDVDKMSERMWGEKYFSAKKKSWCGASADGAIRSFEQFVIDPIQKILKVCESGDTSKLDKMMGALGATITAADKQLEGNALFHRMMQVWLPAGAAISGACNKFVPDPKKAQEKRFTLLATGPTSDASSQAIKNCDPNGTLLYQITKMTPQLQTPGRFYCLGRVWSGTCAADKCYTLDDDYVPEHARNQEPAEEAAPEAAAEEEEAEKPEAGAKPPPKAAPKGGSCQERRIQGVLICKAKEYTVVNKVPAGNLCAVSGIDQFISKRTTIVGSNKDFPLRKPTFSVSPVVRMSLTPQDVKQLPKMVQGVQRLCKSCPLVEVALEESGGHVVAGCGVEHMRVLKRDLETEYLPEVKVNWGAPSVAYRETVTVESTIMCLSKSPNKHNRLFVKAEPISEEVCRAVEEQRIYPTQEFKARAKMLDKEFGWDKTDAQKIWGFGPGPEEAGAAHGANILVDQTKGCQYLNEIKESVNSGLLWAAKEGPICEENMRGIRFNLHDVKLHADSIHRGMGQVQPTARRVFYAATMMAECKLVEPVFMCNIESPTDAQPGIMQALGACRGELVMAEENGSRVSVQAYVPIAETIGNTPFATVLSQKTNGKAFVNYKFDHWEPMPSNPFACDPKTFKPSSKAAEIMMTIRERKGMKLQPPDFADYYDKL